MYADLYIYIHIYVYIYIYMCIYIIRNIIKNVHLKIHTFSRASPRYGTRVRATPDLRGGNPKVHLHEGSRQLSAEFGIVPSSRL